MSSPPRLWWGRPCLDVALDECMEGTMPKRGKMFEGITRQVVISDETHQLLCAIAQHENKYIGELADEILRRVLTRRQGESQRTNGMGHPHPLPHATGTP